MTLISQADHLTAGAGADFGPTGRGWSYATGISIKRGNEILFQLSIGAPLFDETDY